MEQRNADGAEPGAPGRLFQDTNNGAGLINDAGGGFLFYGRTYLEAFNPW